MAIWSGKMRMNQWIYTHHIDFWPDFWPEWIPLVIARADFEHIYLNLGKGLRAQLKPVKSTSCKKPWLWRYWRHIYAYLNISSTALRCERSLAQIHGSVVDCERASNVTWLRPRARRPDPGTNTQYNSKLIKLVKYCKIVQCHQFSSAFEVSEVSFVLAVPSWNILKPEDAVAFVFVKSTICKHATAW